MTIKNRIRNSLYGKLRDNIGRQTLSPNSDLRLIICRKLDSEGIMIFPPLAHRRTGRIVADLKQQLRKEHDIKLTTRALLFD